MLKRLRRYLLPKSLRRLEEMQEYFLVHKGVHVSKEELATWCIEVCHKKVMKEGRL